MVVVNVLSCNKQREHPEMAIQNYPRQHKLSVARGLRNRLSTHITDDTEHAPQSSKVKHSTDILENIFVSNNRSLIGPPLKIAYSDFQCRL